MEKRRFKIIVLVLIEQLIKVFINANYLESNIPIIKPLVYFSPMFNRDYSWINGLFNLGINKAIHIVLVVVTIVFLYLFYRYLRDSLSVDIEIGYILMMSGAVCSLIDKVFWDGSLDYIYLRGLFTFDLKDAYMSLAVVLALYGLIFNRDLDRELDEISFKGFMDHIRKK